MMRNAMGIGQFSSVLVLCVGSLLGCQPAEQLEPGTGTLSGAKPAVAVRNGQALATWHRGDGVHVSSFQGGSWSVPQVLGPGTFPEVAVSSADLAVVLFRASSALKAATRTPGGWTTHTIDATPPSGYAVAMEGGGRVVAVWSVSGEVRASIKEPEGWLGPTVLSSSSASGRPAVAVNDTGVAFAAWCGPNSRMWGARRVWPGPWEAASSSSTDCCQGPALDTPGPGISVGVSATGMAIMVGSTTTRVCAKRYVPGSGWTGTSVLGTPGGDATSPQVAVNPDGKALVAWNNFGAGGEIKLRAYDPVSGWASVLTGPSTGTGQIQVGIGSTGNGAVVYRGGGGLIKAVPYVASSGTLDDPVTVASSPDTLYYLRIGFDPSEASQGVSIWQRTGVGAENIWASRLGI